MLIAATPGRPYNVGAERAVSIADLAQMVAGESRVEIACTRVPGRIPDRLQPTGLGIRNSAAGVPRPARPRAGRRQARPYRNGLPRSESTTSLGAVALMADTVSIIVMELVDNAIMLVVPGAMSTSLLEPIFWGSLVASLALAFLAAYPA